MKRPVFLLLTVCLSTPAQAQCLGGTCPNWSINGAGASRPSAPIVRQRPPDPPSCAWRFVEPTGHYRAVVRVRGDSGVMDRGEAHKLGSGVAVRWATRTVVLTASHVVRGCRRVLVYLAKPKRWATAATIKLDDRWDVAILSLAEADAAELAPAEVAWGDEATPKPGARLECCGLGPDGRLAVNSGIVLGYRGNGLGRSADWIDVSGPAREGDSGGPVFDGNGQVVGILWGTDNQTVTATQGGYLHRLLAESLGEWHGESGVLAGVQTPPPPQPTEVASQACVGRLFPRLSQPKRPTLPEPKVVVNPDPEVRSSLGRIEGALAQVAQNTAPQPAPSQPREVPAWAKFLCIAGALVAGAFVFYVVQQN
jgi:hypothetical protein